MTIDGSWPHLLDGVALSAPGLEAGSSLGSVTWKRGSASIDLLGWFFFEVKVCSPIVFLKPRRCKVQGKGVEG
jgi:hypothetical protein